MTDTTPTPQWMKDWCRKIVHQALANRGWPVIGNSDEVEALALAEDLNAAFMKSRH